MERNTCKMSSANYVEIREASELKGRQQRRVSHGRRSHSHAMHSETSRGQYLQIFATMVVISAVVFNRGDHALSAKVHPAGLSALELKPNHAGPPTPRIMSDVVKPTRTTMEETIEFKLPRSAKAGQILHVVVPGQHDLQPVRVPMGAKSGMMLSVKVPAKRSLLEEEEGGGQEEVGAPAETGDDDIVEEVEEDAELVEEDVEFTWTHFFLLIAFVGFGTALMFYFVKGFVMGFGPLDVDPRRIVDHPCRHHDKSTAEKAAAAMERRRQNGADDDTPNSTPRDSGSRGPTARSGDSPRDGPEKGKSVRQMGAGGAFAKKKDAVGTAIETLHDEGQEVKRTAVEHQQGAAGAQAARGGATGKDAVLDDGEGSQQSSRMSADVEVALVSQEVFEEVWERGKWLVMLMIFQSLASIVLAQFEDLIKAHVVIALFLTMLIGSGGNAGGQSVAKAIHEIAVRGRTQGDMHLLLNCVKRQLGVALWLGLILGWTAWVRVWIFHGGYENSMAIAISCSIIVFSSVILGAVLPYAMLAAGLDEIHSGAVIQVFMDIYGVSVTCIVCWSMWG